MYFRIISIALCFCFFSMQSQAQCTAFEKELKERSYPQMREWKATLTPLKDDIYTLTVELKALKVSREHTKFEGFYFSHYGFEVLTGGEEIRKLGDKRTAVRFFGNLTKKGAVWTRTLQLRKEKDAAIYQIQGTGRSGFLHHTDGSSCSCWMGYLNTFELFHQDPGPKTLIIGNYENYLAQESGKYIQCGEAR